MDAYETVLARRSVRKYTSEPVAREWLLKVINAARLAPTARNEQPWEFVVLTDPARLRQLGEMTDHGKFIADAPACIAVLCQDTKYYLEDGSAATTQMMIAAHTLGLGTCWVAGDKKAYAPRIVEFLGGPADHRLVALIAIGHPAEDPHPNKRALDEVVHWETF